MKSMATFVDELDILKTKRTTDLKTNISKIMVSEGSKDFVVSLTKYILWLS